LQDSQGRWWQLSHDGKWLTWNGVSWVTVAASPQPQAAAPSPAAQASRAEAGGRVQRLARPLAAKSEGWWGITSVIGGAIAGGLWYWYTSLDKALGNPDWETSLIMIAVPIGLLILKKPIDRLLAPTLKIRRKVPRGLIVGLGIAAPYFIANYLYSSRGLSNYPLIRWAVFWGPVVSYLIVRTPRVPVSTRIPAGPSNRGGFPSGTPPGQYGR
jgi:hypothetical protein